MSREIQTRKSKSTPRINKRCIVDEVEDGRPRESCQSCTGRVIADCVAVCCCPCAVVNFFALTFLKLPWMLGRRCLGKKKKEKKLQNYQGKDEISRKEEGENGEFEKVVTIIEAEDESCKYSARFEAERVWLEMYKVDNLGFGRVSFNGIQSLG